MHSSRIRTARLLVVSSSIRWGVLPNLLDADPQDADPPPDADMLDADPLDADPPRCRLPSMQTPLEADPLDADPPRCRPPLDADPP